MFGWMKRQASELWADVRAFVEGRVPGEDEQVLPSAKCYRVPDALAKRVLQLAEDKARAKLQGQPADLAHYQLWRFIGDRCPETRTGRWQLTVDGKGHPWVWEVEP